MHFTSPLTCSIVDEDDKIRSIPCAPLGSVGKILESWINRASMTHGKVVAPRRMPDEAPGLEDI